MPGPTALLLADALESAGAGPVDLGAADVAGETVEVFDAWCSDERSPAELWSMTTVQAWLPDGTEDPVEVLVAAVVAWNEALAALGEDPAWGGAERPFPSPAWAVESSGKDDWMDTVRGWYRPLWPCEGVRVIPTTGAADGAGDAARGFFDDAPDADAAAATEAVAAALGARANQPGDLAVRLLPGVAFGTGAHPTTRLCLAWLRRAATAQTTEEAAADGDGAELPRGASVVDYGAGSGVLALVALGLGAGSAAATDVDPLSVSACRRNAALNGRDGVPAALEAALCGWTSSEDDPLPGWVGRADVVVSNILRGPLLDLAPRLVGYARAGGWLCLSGVKEGDQADAVAARLVACGVEEGTVGVATLGGWALVVGRKSGG